MNRSGYVFIFSAPSGAGKTTIVHRVLAAFPALRFSVSATTRPIREGEKHGKDYYFLSQEDFRRKIDGGEFLEWEEVYAGRFYGTLRAEVSRLLEAGVSVVFDVDVKGGINIKKEYGSQAASFFIQPPSLETLRERLESRGTDSPADIAHRLEKAGYEMTFRDRFDHVIVNDDLERAVAEVTSIVSSFLETA